MVASDDHAGGGRSVELRGLDGQRFPFAPGARCLELALTGGFAERAVFETLHTPGTVSTWLREALDLPVAAATDDDLHAARQLREGIWQGALVAATGGALPPRWVEVLNAAAAAPPPVPRIDRGRKAWREPVRVDQALSVLARDAIELLTGPRAGRIRQCEGRDCTLLFVDTSRPGRRRWCSMQRCGNRAKTRSFRARQRREEQA